MLTDFRIALTGTSEVPVTFSLVHNFNGPVRWWVVDTTVGNPVLSQANTSTVNRLDLTSETADATVVIRVVSTTDY